MDVLNEKSGVYGSPGRCGGDAVAAELAPVAGPRLAVGTSHGQSEAPIQDATRRSKSFIYKKKRLTKNLELRQPGGCAPEEQSRIRVAVAGRVEIVHPRLWKTFLVILFDDLVPRVNIK